MEGSQARVISQKGFLSFFLFFSFLFFFLGRHIFITEAVLCKNTNTKKIPIS